MPADRPRSTSQPESGFGQRSRKISGCCSGITNLGANGTSGPPVVGSWAEFDGTAFGYKTLFCSLADSEGEINLTLNSVECDALWYARQMPRFCMNLQSQSFSTLNIRTADSTRLHGVRFQSTVKLTSIAWLYVLLPELPSDNDGTSDRGGLPAAGALHIGVVPSNGGRWQQVLFSAHSWQACISRGPSNNTKCYNNWFKLSHRK